MQNEALPTGNLESIPTGTWNTGTPPGALPTRRMPFLAMRLLLAGIALAGLVVSVLALRVHNMDSGAAPPCAVSENWDCGAVNHSRFAVFPPRSFDEAADSTKTHIPVAVFGIVGYGLMLTLAMLGRFWLVLEFAQVGFFFAAFLTYLEAFVLQKWCIYCVWSQVIVTVLLLASAAAVFLRHRALSTRAT